MLGALLLSRDAIGAVSEQGLRPDDFYKPGHQHIFDAIRALYSSGAPVDTITVADELRRAGLLDQIGGTEALHALQNATPAISNAAHYARIVQDTAILRRLIYVAGDIAEMAYGEPDDVTKAVDEAESQGLQGRRGAGRRLDPAAQRVDQGGDGPPRGDVRPRRHHHRHRHRLPRRRRAAVRAAAVDAEHRRLPARRWASASPGTPRWSTPPPARSSPRSSWSSARRAAGRLTVRALGVDGRQREAACRHLLDDGVKPVFKVHDAGRGARDDHGQPPAAHRPRVAPAR